MFRILAHPARWIVEHPTPILLAVAVLTAIAAMSARHIRFDFSTQSMNQGDTEAMAFSEQFKKTFGYEDALVLVVMEATGPRDVLDRRSLTWQAAIAGDLQKLDQVVSVQTIATLTQPQFSASETDAPTTVPVIDRFPVDEAGERGLRRIVERSATIKGTLISRDATVAALLIFIDPALRELEPISPCGARITLRSRSAGG